MTEKVREYREKHKKCLYCQHLETKFPPNSGFFFVCRAKEKFIADDFPDMRKVPRVFCSCYEVKE